MNKSSKRNDKSNNSETGCIMVRAIPCDRCGLASDAPAIASEVTLQAIGYIA